MCFFDCKKFPFLKIIEAEFLIGYGELWIFGNDNTIRYDGGDKKWMIIEQETIYIRLVKTIFLQLLTRII